MSDWTSLREQEMSKPYWSELEQFVADERSRTDVYPPEPEVYEALDLTPLDKVKVVILGQDPYHGEGEAHGLAFSVKPGVPVPPSLRNIFTLLEKDLGIEPPDHGCLTHWAEEGVLLLNTALTVSADNAGSHLSAGWRTFTEAVIMTVNDSPRPTVFILWGSKARVLRRLVTGDHHLVIESSHPSPLGAYRGFLESTPFSEANAFLEEHGRGAINWAIPNQ